MPRTIVLSDLHGRLDPLTAALDHARFDASADQLIVAGDLIDVGYQDALSAAEQLGATVLAGNHEVAAALGLRISPQHLDSIERGAEFAERIIGGDWKLCTAVDGWLISHAGISATFSDIVNPFAGDATAIAAELNDRFVSEMTTAYSQIPVAWADLERYRILGGPAGPLWFRPQGTEMLPSGLRQIAGHTPPELLAPADVQRLASSGFLLVDPGGHGGGRADTPAFRYGMIEGGSATVVEG